MTMTEQQIRKNSFTNTTGSNWLRNPLFIILMLSLVVVAGFIIVKSGIVAAIGFLFLPFLLTYFFYIFIDPRIGFIGLLIYNYFALGATRYLGDIPLGLGVDAHLILILLSLFLNSFFKEIPWKNVRRDIILLALIWFVYALFQLVNPEAASREAWIYAMRGVSLHMLLTIPLVFMVFNKEKDLLIFLKIWAVLTLLGTLKGVMQKFLGPDPWEQAWLNGGGDLTHVLFGKLRIFSFFSDAGQFGAAQGHAGIVFLLLAFVGTGSKKLRWFFAFVGLAAIYGMMISGTRGAIAVPIMGLAIFSVLMKNFKIMISGVIAGILIVAFFMFTNIGQGNDTIRRMRTAFDPEDASLQVRLDNQRLLKNYMKSRPFGGGIGSSGNWGMRFSPNTFLAQTPTDSWYVMIWAEQGIVGLVLHLFILLFIVVKSAYVILFKLKKKQNIRIAIALLSGLWGIIVASYGNGILGQMPTGIISYVSIAFLFLMPQWEKENENITDGTNK